eukprot:TRINITY_DN3272_c0_g1_i1.p1 TRINITY_DN3272_c0_g1~~TRINITY_DN3272_c0_g1_i1.p1  ORF type:complete len:100 (+),score=2.07 TRINITY_DN3272_c0_g1_i1:134-433(+)
MSNEPYILLDDDQEIGNSDSGKKKPFIDTCCFGVCSKRKKVIRDAKMEYYKFKGKSKLGMMGAKAGSMGASLLGVITILGVIAVIGVCVFAFLNINVKI